MHQMDLEYEHGCINNIAIWKRGVKVCSPCIARWRNPRVSGVRLIVWWRAALPPRKWASNGSNHTQTTAATWEKARDGNRGTTYCAYWKTPTAALYIQIYRNQSCCVVVNAKQKKVRRDGSFSPGDAFHVCQGGNVKNSDTGRVCVCVCVCVCVFAYVSLCVHMYSDCDGGGGGGCLPVWDSEQRAGGLGMEQRICIDCFCASELFSRCQSCLHQLRGKLQHLHREAFSFLSFFFNLFIYFFYFYNGRCIYNVRGFSRCSTPLQVLAKPMKLERGSSDKKVKLGQKLSFFFFLARVETQRRKLKVQVHRRELILWIRNILLSRRHYQLRWCWGVFFSPRYQRWSNPVHCCGFIIASALTYFCFIRNEPFVFQCDTTYISKDVDYDYIFFICSPCCQHLKWSFSSLVKRFKYICFSQINKR